MSKRKRLLGKALKTAISIGAWIDILFMVVRFSDNKTFFKKKLSKRFNIWIKRGGDWERRNREKTYNGSLFFFP